MDRPLPIPDDLTACQALIEQLQERNGALQRELSEQQRELSEQQRELEQQCRVVEEQRRLADEQRGLVEEQRHVLDETSACYQELLEEHAAVKEELALLRRWAFGRRRERFVEAGGQLHLFAPPQGEPALLFELQDSADNDKQQPRRRRRRRRGLDLSRLPQHRIEHDVPDEEKRCETCGREKDRIGADESHVLHYRPAVLEVAVHVLPKYACRCCRDGVTSPPVPPRPIARSIAGPGLISFLVVSKFGDHLPLYRLEDIFTRHGLRIPRSTLCDWVRQAAELLRPLADLQKQIVLASPVLWTDDTPVRMLDRDANGGSRLAHFWTYIGDDTHPYSVYDFTPNHTRDGPAAFLQDYRGYLQADAYGGYDGIYLESAGRIVEVACGAHLRRKFADARSHAPRESAQVLEGFRQLYDVEDRARNLSVEMRLDLRQREAVPVLARMQAYLDALAGRALPKSSLGKAVTYARNQWQAFCRYSTDGRLTIDNNVSERTLRAQAIGRKNWLFLGHEQAGPRAAVLYTILAGAKRHRLEPWVYLNHVLLHLAGEDTPNLERLLPDRWAAAQPEHVLTHRLEESRRKRARQQARRADRR
jgi:transposase